MKSQEVFKGLNSIHNGNFDFWNRGTGPINIASDSPLADRWRGAVNLTGGVVTQSRSTDVPNYNSLYSWKATVTTAQASMGASNFGLILQFIEGNQLRIFAGKTVTLSFWVKSSKAGVYGIGFRNGNSDRSLAKSYTITNTNTWEFKSVTLNHDTTGTWNYDTGRGMSVGFAFAAGSNYVTSPDTWTSGNYLSVTGQENLIDTLGATFQISQVMLNEGRGPLSNFTLAGGDITGEELICRRYFLLIGSSALHAIPTSIYNDGTNIDTICQFPTVMRASPTPSFKGTANTDYYITNYASGGPQTGFSFSFNNYGTSFVRVRATKSSHGLTGNPYLFFGASGGILLDAET